MKNKIGQAIVLNLTELPKLLQKVQAAGTEFTTNTYKECIQYTGLAKKEFQAGNYDKAQEFIYKATEKLKILRKRTE